MFSARGLPLTLRVRVLRQSHKDLSPGNLRTSHTDFHLGRGTQALKDKFKSRHTPEPDAVSGREVVCGKCKKGLMFMCHQDGVSPFRLCSPTMTNAYRSKCQLSGTCNGIIRRKKKKKKVFIMQITEPHAELLNLNFSAVALTK